MPTPSGLLKAGDLLRHKDDPQVTYRVIYRTGNERSYAVMMERTDGQPFRTNGHLKTQGFLLNAEWNMRHNGWSLVDEHPACALCGAELLHEHCAKMTWPYTQNNMCVLEPSHDANHRDLKGREW